MLDTVKTLCYLSGVSGSEEEVREYLLERALPYGDEIRTDAMGNLLVFKRGTQPGGKTLMLCAHMDEVGLIVTYIEPSGFLRFDCVGGIDRRVLLGKKIYIGRDRVAGVIGTKAYHLSSAEERKKVPAVGELYIDIGAVSGEMAARLVEPGDTAVFDDAVAELGSDYLKAKAIDDRAGCAVLLKILEQDLPCDCWFAFTCQEEVGTRGAAVAANQLQPDLALVIEGTTAADLPGVSGGNRICALGDGVVIPFMDRGTAYDRELWGLLRRLAEENGIPWQTKRKIAGGTDASAIQRSGAGVRVAALACPVRNIHTPASIAHKGDLLNLLKLTELFVHHAAR